MVQVESATPVVSTCTHAIPTTLAPKLPSLQLCPTCTIISQTEAIQFVQEQFEARGGLFESKKDGKDGFARHAHKAAKQAWCTAKIALTNTVDKFEDLLKDKNTPDLDLVKLREALNVWNKKKIMLSRVPGLRYVEGAEEGEPTEDEKEGARLLMAWLKMVVEKEMTKEELKDETRSPVSSVFAQGLNNPQPMLTSPKSSRKDPSAGTSPSMSPREVVIYGQPPVFQRVSVPVPASKEPSGVDQSKHALPAATETTASPLTTVPHNGATPKSILKRPRASTMPDSQSASPSPKRVRTSDFVTISPEHLYIANPSPFQPLSRAATVLPHAAHIFAEHHRRQSKFHRTTRVYVPGVWASEAFSKKVNTSFRGMTHLDMDKQFEEELAEQKQEQELADKLKETSRGWVALWWANKVAPNLDLEKLKMEMQARSEETEVS